MNRNLTIWLTIYFVGHVLIMGVGFMTGVGYEGITIIAMLLWLLTILITYAITSGEWRWDFE